MEVQGIDAGALERWGIHLLAAPPEGRTTGSRTAPGTADAGHAGRRTRAVPLVAQASCDVPAGMREGTGVDQFVIGEPLEVDGAAVARACTVVTSIPPVDGPVRWHYSLGGAGTLAVRPVRGGSSGPVLRNLSRRWSRTVAITWLLRARMPLVGGAETAGLSPGCCRTTCGSSAATRACAGGPAGTRRRPAPARSTTCREPERGLP